MKKFAKALYAFIFVFLGVACMAAVCGCKNLHEHKWPNGYEIIEGTETHVKRCGVCGRFKDVHTAEWSDDNDTACNYEDCDITRIITPANAIIVTAPSDSVIKGGTIQLEASEEDVIWSIPENTVGIFISADGLLTVTEEATATSVVVTASKAGFISGTITITITKEAEPISDDKNVFDMGIYADEAFNLLEIKSDSEVCLNGEDYAVGTIEDGRAALTSNSHTGYISKTETDEGVVYAVEIYGVLNGKFVLFPDFGLSVSDFVGTYEASNGIIVNIGGTYYKCNRFAFSGGGRAIVWCVEVSNTSGEVKQGESEVCFPLMTAEVAVTHNIIYVGNNWRIAALDENADRVAIVYYTGERESVMRVDYVKTDADIPSPANRLPIAAGEIYIGGRLTIACDSAGSYYFGSADFPLYVVSGNPTDGYLILTSETSGVRTRWVNYLLKFETVERVKRINVYEPDGNG